MPVFLMGALATVVIAFLTMIAVHLLRMERRLQEVVLLAEALVSKLYKGE